MRVRTGIVSSVASLAMLATLLSSPTSVAAHVNRTVGPYTFFLVLIEEPTFETNRAGFAFWARDRGRSVQGLDRTLEAVAITTSRQVALVVSPVDGQGFYDVETDTGGRPFDPGQGGDWTLRLTGTVEGTSVDVSFPVTFPVYPRLSTSSTPAPPVDDQAGATIWLAADAALFLGFLVLLSRKVRGRRSPR